MQEEIKDRVFEAAPQPVEPVVTSAPEGAVSSVAPSGGTGLAPNIAGALCYLAGFITGIVFLMLEKDSKFVRFHAMQSIVASVGLIVASIVLGFIPILGWVAGLLLNLAGVALWVMLMVKAFRGEEWEVPFVGKIAREQVAKMG